MGDILIELEQVKKAYTTGEAEVEALRSISMMVSPGESVAVMGPSGSGKSTLLSIIGGLNPPTEGQVIIDGIDLYRLNSERRADFRREYLGFVFQQFQLIPYLTAIQNTMLPLTTTRYPVREKQEMAMQALERVGMETKSNRLPNQLSGGEQERVAIARAIVNSPPLMLADEPTGNLDTRMAQDIMELFSSVNDSGLTVLMVTHNPENTKYMKRTITMQDGKIVDDTGSLAVVAGFGIGQNESAGDLG